MMENLENLASDWERSGTHVFRVRSHEIEMIFKSIKFSYGNATRYVDFKVRECPDYNVLTVSLFNSIKILCNIRNKDLQIYSENDSNQLDENLQNKLCSIVSPYIAKACRITDYGMLYNSNYRQMFELCVKLMNENNGLFVLEKFHVKPFLSNELMLLLIHDVFTVYGYHPVSLLARLGVGNVRFFDGDPGDINKHAINTSNRTNDVILSAWKGRESEAREIASRFGVPTLYSIDDITKTENRHVR